METSAIKSMENRTRVLRAARGYILFPLRKE